MKLLIISAMPHHRREGVVVGWGPTAQEIDHLSSLFESVRHLAPLSDGQAPASALAYQSERVTLVPLLPAGGETLRDKLQIVALVPRWLRAMRREIARADMVHVRCPANIPLFAILLLAFCRRPKPRWIKYAGNWKPDAREARSYTVQRWWLRRNFARAVVTVNGHWDDSPSHVRTFYNPSLTREEEVEAASIAQAKTLDGPIQLLSVGRLEEAKGVGRAITILAHLRDDGVDARLDLVGDGPQRLEFERRVGELSLQDHVTFHGWVARTALGPLYKRAQILLFPTSSSEGWPKVLSEAMAYGAVPLAGKVSSIPQYLERFETGRALDPHDTDAFAAAVRAYRDDPELWRRESQNGARAAHHFTYDFYLDAVRELLRDVWDEPSVEK